MNIALIGSGGREHVLCEKIRESKLVNNIICIPGNAGTSKIAKNIEIDRKVLAQLAFSNPDAFKNIVDQVRS